MRRTINILLLVALMTVGVNLSGQQASSKPGNGKTAPKKMFMPNVYLGHSEYKGGLITAENFNTLLKQGLTSHDSLGNKYKVVNFYFSYKEWKVYEDSIGNLKKFIDFSSEYCKGDTITHDMATSRGDTSSPEDMSYSIYQRVKPGDTIYFDHISVERIGRNSLLSISDTVAIEGKGMKCVIIK